MRLLALCCLAGVWLGCLVTVTSAAPLTGALAFRRYCSECHPDGGNVVTPAKNLRVLTLHANGLVAPRDLVAKMRNPGPGMVRLDAKELPDDIAYAIAEYILTTFK